MPPLRMGIDHNPVRKSPRHGQVCQVRGAPDRDIEPGRHPVADTGFGVVPFPAGIGDVKHVIEIHAETGLADNARKPITNQPITNQPIGKRGETSNRPQEGSVCPEKERNSPLVAEDAQEIREQRAMAAKRKGCYSPRFAPPPSSCSMLFYWTVSDTSSLNAGSIQA